MKNISIFIGALLLLTFKSYSQYTIEGKVTDNSGDQPLVGASVVIENTFNGCYSDLNGKYKIQKAESGRNTIIISYLGYITTSINIDLNRDTTINFKLERSAILEDEVIIKATRADEYTPSTYKNIKKEDIENINLGQDLPILLKTTPSLITTSDAGAGIGYTGLRIRGTDITRINVTINGIPLNDAESHGVYFVDLPDISSSIDNMQIQRGVGTSTNGAAAFGASINIETNKLNTKPFAEINNSYGSFNTLKHSYSVGSGLINGKWSFEGRLSKISSDGYIDRAFTDLRSYYGSAAYYGKKSLLKFITFSGKEKTYQAWWGVPKYLLETNRTYNPSTYENETDNYQQDHYHLHYSYEVSDKINFNTALHYTKGVGYYEQFKEDEYFYSYGLNPILLNDTFIVVGSDTNVFPDSVISSTDLIRQKWLDNHFYGLTYSLIYNNKKNIEITLGGGWNRYNGDHYGNIIWAQFTSNAGNNYEWYFNKGSKTDMNIFGKLNYHFAKRYNVYGDIQIRKINFEMKGIHDNFMDLTQKHDFLFFNPKFGILARMNNSNSAYFSISVANREPSRNNFRDADSNYNPVHETLYDYELGYNYSSNKIKANFNLYYMHYNNQLVLTGEINDVGAPIMTNVPFSYRSGIELSVSAILDKKLKWDMNVTYSMNKIWDYTDHTDVYDENWNPQGQKSTYLGETDLAFSPNLIFSNIFTYSPVKNLDLILISKYVDEQYIDNSSNEDKKLDSYLINDLSINYNLKVKKIGEVSLNLLVNNIFNVEYESNAWVYSYYLGSNLNQDFGYYPQATRNYLLGLSLKF